MSVLYVIRDNLLQTKLKTHCIKRKTVKYYWVRHMRQLHYRLTRLGFEITKQLLGTIDNKKCRLVNCQGTHNLLSTFRWKWKTQLDSMNSFNSFFKVEKLFQINCHRKPNHYRTGSGYFSNCTCMYDKEISDVDSAHNRFELCFEPCLEHVT